MSLALWSSHQLFQRMDSALRSLLSHHRHQVQTNLSLKPTHPQRPLRVLRVAEEQRPPRHAAGRMVISGRMADVCAELDRLIELENQRQGFRH
jgi:hypothetical protein